MADLNDFASEANLYKLASGDTAPIDAIGQEYFEPKQPGADMLPEDFMPMMPQQHAGYNPRPFVSGYNSQQVGNGPPPDKDLQSLLTNVIRSKESTGNYAAVNPKSTASGAYQYTDGTWNGYGGYPKAALAPPEVQDRRFQEDIAQRLAAYGNDPYKAIVAHYLPALADRPDTWDKPFKVAGRPVQPALSYLKYVVKGSPLEAGLNDYLMRGIRPNLVASAR